jgi:hypothetical protein
LAVRQLSDAEGSEDDIIMTSKFDKSKKDVAIKQIERRFQAAKKVKVGVSKG